LWHTSGDQCSAHSERHLNRGAHPVLSAPARTVDPMQELTPAAAIAWEEQHQFWRHAGAKEAASRAEFDVGAVPFYAALRVALHDPECILAHPATAARLRRILAARQGLRNVS
jgi:hypothetical protein